MKRHGRRPRFKTPLGQARDRALGALKRPLGLLRPRTRFVVGFIALAVLSTLLLARTRSSLSSAEVYQEGEIVRADVVAPADITSEDRHQTELRREAALREVPQVWDYDPRQVEGAVQSFHTSWLTLQRQSEAHAPGNNNAANANSPRADLLWPGPADDRQAAARAVAAHGFDPRALDAVSRLMREHAGGNVYDEADAGQLRPEGQAVEVRGPQASVNTTQAAFTSLTAARENLRLQVVRLRAGVGDAADLEQDLSAARELVRGGSGIEGRG
jgi:membrane-associated HD superfamily phosphohydrolase